MATTIWKGYLSFGLISIPIKLHRAARAEKVSFRQLHKADATRVRQTYVREAPAPQAIEAMEEEEETPAPSAATRRQEALPFVSERRSVFGAAPEPVQAISSGRRAPEPAREPEPAAEPQTVSRSELVKGYEYAKDQYVVISKEDLEKITPQTAREMQILEFVRLADVDPIYFETSYYVIPDKAGERPYALLLQALRRTGYVAVGQLAMHNREHIVIIRPGRSGIVLHMMFYENEVHREDEYRVDTAAVVEKELQLASTLIESLAAPFEPEKYRDTYKEKLDELIAAKVAGQQTVESPAPQRTAPVVNILEALEKSLAQSRKPPATAPPEEKAPKKKRSGGRG